MFKKAHLKAFWVKVVRQFNNFLKRMTIEKPMNSTCGKCSGPQYSWFYTIADSLADYLSAD
jgi:hypothetical protein